MPAEEDVTSRKSPFKSLWNSVLEQDSAESRPVLVDLQFLCLCGTLTSAILCAGIVPMQPGNREPIAYGGYQDRP